jgi:hypothetical protein
MLDWIIGILTIAIRDEVPGACTRDVAFKNVIFSTWNIPSRDELQIVFEIGNLSISVANARFHWLGAIFDRGP